MYDNSDYVVCIADDAQHKAQDSVHIVGRKQSSMNLCSRASRITNRSTTYGAPRRSLDINCIRQQVNNNV